MGFNRAEVEKLLASCHRRCCICHRYCGVKIETDHIEQKADNGQDHIENAIPVCFECHAEIHLYNDRHPRGRKFTSGELKRHRDNWLAICNNRPEALIEAPRIADVGPVQSLIDELEFNRTICLDIAHPRSIGCKFRIREFDKAITEGVISLMNEDMKSSIFAAYRLMRRANSFIENMVGIAPVGNPYAEAQNRALAAVREAGSEIERPLASLYEFLGRT